MPTATVRSTKKLSLQELSYVLTAVLFIFIAGISVLIASHLKSLAEIADYSRQEAIPRALEQHEIASQAKQLGLFANVIAESDDARIRTATLERAATLATTLQSNANWALTTRLGAIARDIRELGEMVDLQQQHQQEMTAQMGQVSSLFTAADLILSDLINHAAADIRSNSFPDKSTVEYYLTVTRLQGIFSQLRGHLLMLKAQLTEEEIQTEESFYNGLLLLAQSLLESAAIPQQQNLQSILEDFHILSYLFKMQRETMLLTSRIRYQAQQINNHVNNTSIDITGNAGLIASQGADDIAARAKESLATALFAFGILGIIFFIMGIALRHEIVKPLFAASESLKNLSRKESIPPQLADTDLKEIDEINQAVLALSNALKETESANERLVAMAQMKTNFTSSVSHELRTPLTSVRGFIKLIRKDLERLFATDLALDEKMHGRTKRVMANLDIVAKESERLGMLIDDVLDIAKIDSGRMSWRDEPTDLTDVIIRTKHAISGEFLLKPQVKLNLDIAKNLPIVLLDANRLQQVLLNLLNNAIKFTPEGIILLRCWQEEGKIFFSVKDNGVGIKPEDQDIIFEKFQQASHNADYLKDKPKGTGLGLAICKQIVEHYGGQIKVISSFGAGSTFLFYIPVANVEEILATSGKPTS